MTLISDPIERTTAFTDILLALVAFGGIFILHLGGLTEVTKWKIAIWSGAVGLIGLAAGLGAAAHGLELTPGVHRRVWQILNLALALAVSLFLAGVIHDLWGAATALKVLPFILAMGCGFYLATLIFPGIFFVFILYEALALTGALSAYIYLAFSGRVAGAGLMAAGVFISMVAAVFQARKKTVLRLVWTFDHNAIYHLVQIIGLLFLLAGLRWSLAAV